MTKTARQLIEDSLREADKNDRAVKLMQKLNTAKVTGYSTKATRECGPGVLIPADLWRDIKAEVMLLAKGL